jgi:tRNA (guanine-N7-)-methyltransferase
MGKRNKLKKFAELTTFPNVYQCFNPLEPVLEGKDGEIDLKGKWGSEHFKNDNPIVLELACGRGEYTLALAKKYPDKNFIGMDVKGARIWQGASIAINEDMSNAAFLRSRIEALEHFFAEKEIDEIWITFPDPFENKANRRLTNHNFNDRYRKVLKADGIVQLKTDSDSLWENTLVSLNADPLIKITYSNDNIYSKALDYPELEVKTYYEKSHLKKGRLIKYVRYTL